MRFSTFTLVASLTGYAMAQAMCNTVCKPVKELMAGCKAEMMPVSKEATNCVCMNKSFDVAKLGGLCMACIMSKGKESEGSFNATKTIDAVLTVVSVVMMQVGMACPFQAIEYTPAADAMAQGVVVMIPKESVPTGTGTMPNMPGMSSMPGMPGMPGMMNEATQTSMSSIAVGFAAVLLAFGLA
jgi:hypothetical protein